MLKEMARESVCQALTGRAGGPNRLVIGVIAATSAVCALPGCERETIDLLPPSDGMQAGRSGLGPSGGTGGSSPLTGSGGVPESPWWTGGDTGSGGGNSPPPGAGGYPYAGTEGSDCSDGTCLPGLVCNPFSGKCERPCESNDDCDDPRRPLCDRGSGSSGLCVQCLTNGDCEWARPERPVCMAYMRVCGCGSDGDCEPPNAYCDPSFFNCKRCLRDEHCPPDRHCDPLYFQCQECVTDEHCPEQTYCVHNLFVCRECLINEHCPEQYYCDPSNYECIPWE